MIQIKRPLYSIPELLEEWYKDPSFTLQYTTCDAYTVTKEFVQANEHFSAKFKTPLFDQITDRHGYLNDIWLYPSEYSKINIEKYLFELCSTKVERQRVSLELDEYKARGKLELLKFMKYFVDTLREKGLIWGVGRGSSVASYCLFLLGVHKIDSIAYDLPMEDFFKE